MNPKQYVNEITGIHKAQLLNYLKATGIKLGILVNFSRERETQLMLKEYMI
ncbi:MAG: GxxExxY protein [Candidatus Methanoperedens sp.]|nr:GxxExxY protein [Candidatus Methanoperedens sp.]